MGLFPSYQQPQRQSRLFRPFEDDPGAISPPMGTPSIPGIPGIPTQDMGGLLPTPTAPLLADEPNLMPPPDSTDVSNHSFVGDTNTPEQVKRNRLFGDAEDSGKPSFKNTPKQVQKIRLQGGVEAKTPADDEPVTHGNFPEISGSVSRETKEKKPGIIGRLFGYQDPAKQDELGLSVPQKDHRGVLSTILQYALPTLFGAVSGVGVLPGLMTASAQEGNKENRYAKAMQDYEKLRGDILTPSSDMKTFGAYSQMTPEQQKAFTDMKAASMPQLGIQAAALAETGRHNVANEGLEADRIQAAKEAAKKGNKVMSSESAKTYQIAHGARDAINQLTSEISKGSSLVAPQYFDRKVNFLLEDLTDRLGRLRSGGAIGGKELEKYQSMFPSWRDSKETKLYKLKQLEKEFSGIEGNLSASDDAPTQVGPTSKRPTGATHKGLGPDGKTHWSDKDGNDLGVVE